MRLKMPMPPTEAISTAASTGSTMIRRVNVMCAQKNVLSLLSVELKAQLAAGMPSLTLSAIRSMQQSPSIGCRHKGSQKIRSIAAAQALIITPDHLGNFCGVELQFAGHKIEQELG